MAFFRHPVTRYFLIAFAGTWFFQLPMVLGRDGLGLFAYHVPMPTYVGLFLLSSAVPAVSGAWLTFKLEGRPGLQRFVRRFGQWRVGVAPFLIVTLAYPVLYLAGYWLTTGHLPVADLVGKWSALFTVYLPALLIFPALITWGEEPGWRGFALTRLQTEVHPVIASLIVGALHGVWHLPIFLLVSGPPASGPFNLANFLSNTGTIMVITVLWSWVFNSAGRSILIAVLLHASGNATGPLMGRWFGQLPESMGATMFRLYLGLAVLAIVLTRGRLGNRSDPTPAAAPV